jgi:hypothetical protein
MWAYKKGNESFWESLSKRWTAAMESDLPIMVGPNDKVKFVPGCHGYNCLIIVIEDGSEHER